MTEYWKSVGNYWCQYCKRFVRNDNFNRKQHDNLQAHKDNVARFISESKQRKDERSRDEKNMQREINAAFKAADAAYQKDLMNNIEVGGHPYSTYNTGKDVQKALQALAPDRPAPSTGTITTTYTPSANSTASADVSGQNYADYYNQYYSDPNYYHYYQYYAQYGYYPQQAEEPKLSAAEAKEDEKRKQREYLEQQIKKYRKDDDLPKQAPPSEHTAAVMQQQAESSEPVAEVKPKQKREDEGAPGEWQEVTVEDTYSAYYRPASPSDDAPVSGVKRARSESESDADEDSDDEETRARILAHVKDEESSDHDAAAEVVWKKRTNNNNNDAQRPKKKIRRTII